MHYPSSPLQPGPMYFLVPRKCSIFGIHCEGVPRQVNYLTDEAFDCGKGANAVISQLHHFFKIHGFGETEVFLNADNCCGQNKNNTMMQYLAWRVITGRHNKITLSFLVVGHTKFSPDWCFGLLKQKYRKTDIGSLDALAQCVETSATCNHSQLVGTSDGSLIVPTFEWTSYFAVHFRRIVGIKKYQHFHFDSSLPGIVTVQEHCDSAKTSIPILKDKWMPLRETLPQQIFPKGLSVERQWYLYEQIRSFCPESDKNTTCPLPSVPKSVSRSGTPNPECLRDAPDTPSPTSSPPPKRLCGLCRKPGHNSRRCPNK